MTLTTPNRREVRLILAKYIQGASTLVESANVYAYQEDNLAGVFPVVRIMGSGRARPALTFRGSMATFQFTLQILVLFEGKKDGSDTEDSVPWTSLRAENLLDDVEHELSILFDNKVGYQQNGISEIATAQSAIRKDVVGGETYLIEMIPITVTALYNPI